jgi:hypothetical protein
MNAALWADIMADVSSAERHFAGAAALVDAGALAGEGLDRYRGEMAVMHAMQSGHTSVEAAFQRLLRVLDEPVPTGPDSHADLMRRIHLTVPGDRPAIVSDELAAALDDTRKFRHVAMRSYDVFRVESALPAIASSKVVAKLLRQELEAFRAFLDVG